MFNATTTCDGGVPETCVTQIDAGDLMFILAVILFFLALPGIGLLFNSIFKRS